MSEQAQTKKGSGKWTKVGSVLKAKAPYDKNRDGSDKLYIKFDKSVSFQQGDSLSLFPPYNENAPDYVIFDVLKKNQVIE